MKLTSKDKELIAKTHTLAKQGKKHSSASMILTADGKIYKGLSLSVMTPSSVCCSAVALGSMITAGKNKIDTVVTVNTEGVIYPPCGKCRELFYELVDNDPWVIVSGNEKVKLRTLLPHAWYNVGKKIFNKKKE